LAGGQRDVRLLFILQGLWARGCTDF